VGFIGNSISALFALYVVYLTITQFTVGLTTTGAAILSTTAYTKRKKQIKDDEEAKSIGLRRSKNLLPDWLLIAVFAMIFGGSAFLGLVVLFLDL